MHQLFGKILAFLHDVCVLHIIGFLVRLAVYVNDTVLYLQRLSWQSHASLDVVLAAVGGS